VRQKAKCGKKQVWQKASVAKIFQQPASRALTLCLVFLKRALLTMPEGSSIPQTETLLIQW